MIPDTTLVIVWLVFAHLVADFVLQNDWIALNKGRGTSEGNRALLTHGLHVALCLLPAVFAFGLPGLAYLVLVTVSHVIVDRWKVRATARAGDAAQAAALRRLEQTGSLHSSGLGNAWTAWPGILFLADQVLHLTFALVGWLVLIDGVPLTAQWVDFVNLVLRSTDRTAFHAITLTAVVLVSVFIVNTRGAYYFVLALTSPRDLVEGPATDAAAGGVAPAPGPSAVPTGASFRIEATIAAVERLLIVGLAMMGSGIGIAVIVGLRVAARFRQLEDRGYAEYFLLATLASLGVALGSAVLADAALASLS